MVRICWFLLGFLPAATVVAEEASTLLQARATEEGRAAAATQAGLPAEASATIDRAVAYLIDQQSRDGSWGEHAEVGSTAVALLALFANGITPLSERGGETVTTGLVYLVERSREGKGRLRTPRGDSRYPSDWTHEHILATQALAEGQLICSSHEIRIPGLGDAVQRGAQWIIDMQRPEGGWDYSFRTEGAGRGVAEFTVAALHALWLTHRAGIETRNLKSEIHKGFAFLANLQRENGSVPNLPYSTDNEGRMTGGVAFMFQMAGKPDSPVAEKAIDYLGGPDARAFSYQDEKANADFAAGLLPLHYEALAMHARGGKPWERWRRNHIPQLLAHQQDDGSFGPRGRHPVTHPKDAAIQRSSLACLILATPWRYTLVP